MTVAKNLLFVLLLSSILIGAKAFPQANDTSEHLIVLPMAGYSDEQGLGLGANALWANALGYPNWTASFTFLSSTLYSQNFLNMHIYNTKFLDAIYVEIEGFLNHSGRSLFYGLGNSSSLDNAVQYSINDSDVTARIGLHITPELVIGVGYAHRSTGLDRGSDPTLPQLFDTYSYFPRLSGTTTTSTHVFAIYDTRNSIISPRSGDYVFTSLNQAQPRSGEDLAEQRYTLLVEHFFPVVENDFLVDSRLKFEHQWGEDIPFFLQPNVGGGSSLRAFRYNRFIDAESLVLNIEPRAVFWSPGGAVIERFEASLGLDIGRVANYEFFPLLDGGLHTGWDLGITAFLAGGIPMRIDYGTGPEGVLFYLHLLYPW